MNFSLPGSSVRGIILARGLKWVAISSSCGSSRPGDQIQVSCGSFSGTWTAKSLQSCLTLWNSWTVARQSPLFTGFSRQEYYSWVPYPPLGDLPDPGIERASLMSPALADRFFTTEPPEQPDIILKGVKCGLGICAQAYVDCICLDMVDTYLFCGIKLLYRAIKKCLKMIAP